jgi:hypothetical protein
VCDTHTFIQPFFFCQAAVGVYVYFFVALAYRRRNAFDFHYPPPNGAVKLATCMTTSAGLRYRGRNTNNKTARRDSGFISFFPCQVVSGRGQLPESLAPLRTLQSLNWPLIPRVSYNDNIHHSVHRSQTMDNIFNILISDEYNPNLDNCKFKKKTH